MGSRWRLTAREIEVIELLRTGASTEEIARRLFIALATTRNHIQSIMTKLGVSSRVAAVAAWVHGHGYAPTAEHVLTIAAEEGLNLTDEQRERIRDVMIPPCTCAVHDGQPVEHTTKPESRLISQGGAADEAAHG